MAQELTWLASNNDLWVGDGSQSTGLARYWDAVLSLLHTQAQAYENTARALAAGGEVLDQARDAAVEEIGRIVDERDEMSKNATTLRKRAVLLGSQVIMKNGPGTEETDAEDSKKFISAVTEYNNLVGTLDGKRRMWVGDLKHAGVSRSDAVLGRIGECVDALQGAAVATVQHAKNTDFKSLRDGAAAAFTASKHGDPKAGDAIPDGHMSIPSPLPLVPSQIPESVQWAGVCKHSLTGRTKTNAHSKRAGEGHGAAPVADVSRAQQPIKSDKKGS